MILTNATQEKKHSGFLLPQHKAIYVHFLKVFFQHRRLNDRLKNRLEFKNNLGKMIFDQLILH